MKRILLATGVLAVASLALYPARARADDTETIKAAYPGMTIKVQELAPIDKTAIYGLVLQTDSGGFVKAVRMEGKGAVELLSLPIKPTEVADAKIDFISDGNHMAARIKESLTGGDFLSTVDIFDLTGKPGALLFTMKDALNAEVASTPLQGLLVWQKAPIFLNDSVPPAKYSYFMVKWDEAGQMYMMGPHLLRINGADLPIEADYNNKGVDYYQQGYLVKARSAFQQAQEFAGTAGRLITSNYKMVDAEIINMERQEQTSTGSLVSTIFDKAKLLFYEGQYQACINEIAGPEDAEGIAKFGTVKTVTQDRLAMLGLSYAATEDYDKLHLIDQPMAAAPADFQTRYYAALLDVVSRQKRPDELKKYMIKLEGLDPNDPTLTFYKARYLIGKNDLSTAITILTRYLAAVRGKGLNVERCRLALYEVAALTNDEQMLSDLQKEIDTSPKIDLRWYVEALNFNTAGQTVNPNDVFLHQAAPGD